MSRVFNSKNKKLPLYEVLLRSLENELKDKKQVARGLAGIVNKVAKEGAELEQIGNTVFFSKKKTSKNKTVANVAVFNVDTAFNMANNSKKYLKNLQKQGVNYFFGPVKDKTYFGMAKSIIKKLSSEGFAGKIYGSKTKKNQGYVTVIKIPND